MIQMSPMSWIFMFILNFFTIIFMSNSKEKKFFKNEMMNKSSKIMKW